jgi:hypothetical protein
MIIDSQNYNNKKLGCTEKTLGNCINSALVNILKGIEMFKYNYCEEIPLNKKDIDLAVSIILNTNVVRSLKDKDNEEDFEEKEEKKEQQEEKEEEEHQYIYTPDIIEDINYVPEQQEEEHQYIYTPDIVEDINYVPEQQEEYQPDPINEDYESQQEYEFGKVKLNMGLKNPDEELENIKINLREISNNKDVDFNRLAKYFKRSSFKIEKYRFNKNKHNRIMFFATTYEKPLWNYFDILKQT